MSLRARLTVLTMVIVVAASILIAITSYLTVSALQFGSIDRGLASAVADVRIKGLIDRPRPVPADVFNTVAVAVVDSQGAVRVLRPAGLGGDPLSFPRLTADAVSAARSGAVTVAGSPAFRIVASDRNGRGDTVVVATPLGTVDADLARLRRAIVVALAVLVATSAVVTWLLVRRALRPVDAMVAAARAVAAGDLQSRVPTARAGTEMGALGESLNAMISTLGESMAESHDSEERLRAFVSDASHEIRTPLTVIRGYSDLLLQSSDSRSDVEARALERMASESRRLESLVTQLLALARASTEQQDAAVLTEVDLAQVFAIAFSDVRTLDPDRPVVVTTGPAIVHGSPEQWAQAAANLCQNVMRYTPAGSPVQVDVRTMGGTVRVCVDDAGPGIPVDRRDDMLERFTRLDPSRSTESGGSGLGLSIVKAVAVAHDGDVALDRSPAGGLRVLITVPAVTNVR